MINYILTGESFEVFSVDFYIPLTAYANAFERLMYVEEKLVTLSERHEPLPDKDHPDYEQIYKQQRLNAYRYLRYMEIRKKVSQELKGQSEALSKQLDGIQF